MIRTYELSPRSKTPLYAQLYEAIRADILSGLLPGGEKLPSKRALAEHLSLSKITVERALGLFCGTYAASGAAACPSRAPAGKGAGAGNRAECRSRAVSVFRVGKADAKRHSG